MRRTGLAMLFHGPGQALEPRQIEVPDPLGAEILARVAGCTLCGSDLHTFHGRRAGPVPAILGHEILGRVEAFGPEAPRVDARGEVLREGDRVVWSLVASCGACERCVGGLPQKCVRAFKYGHEAIKEGSPPRGGLSEFCSVVPGTTVLRVPDSLPDALAGPAGCATATVAAILGAAPEVRGRTVLILGAGMLGLTAAAMAHDRGAAAIIVCDLHAARLDRARQFGATAAATPAELPALIPDGADVAIDLAGTPPAFELGLASLRDGGWFGLAGAVFPSAPVPLVVERVVRRHLTLAGLHNYAPGHLLAALDFLERTPFPFADLVSAWLPLERADEAIRLAAGPDALRVGVRPGPA
jgi:alcohol dehydrogenase